MSSRAFRLESGRVILLDHVVSFMPEGGTLWVTMVGGTEYRVDSEDADEFRRELWSGR